MKTTLGLLTLCVLVVLPAGAPAAGVAPARHYFSRPDLKPPRIKGEFSGPAYFVETRMDAPSNSP